MLNKVCSFCRRKQLVFTPYSQVAFFGGINNMNDQRKPGQNSTWTPESAPCPVREQQQLFGSYVRRREADDEPVQDGHQLDAFLEYNNSFKFKKNSDGLSYTAFKGRWVFMLDGFDILNQLSNVTYGVNAQARTSTVLAAHVLTI